MGRCVNKYDPVSIFSKLMGFNNRKDDPRGLLLKNSCKYEIYCEWYVKHPFVT